jgi:Ca-activated chloride channel family protein
MSFAAPLALLGLLALPLVVYGYVVRQRQRSGAAAAFSSPVLAASVMPRRPRWRRHVPMVAFGLALIALVVAAAKPEAKVAVPVKRSAVMLLIDTSGSMAATDVAPSRLKAVRRAAGRFLDRAPSQSSVGLLAFNTAPTSVQSPTTDRASVRADLADLRAGGGTAIGDALQRALRLLANVPEQSGRRLPSAIVLLSDGTSTSGVDQLTEAREAAHQHIPIYTVALGTPTGTITVPAGKGKRGTVVHPAPPDPQALAQIAQASGGQAFTAATAGRLSNVYDHLGTALGHRTVKQEITSSFAGAGLVLLLLGSVLTLGWLRRLI